VKGHFNPELFNPILFNRELFNPMTQKFIVEKFMNKSYGLKILLALRLQSSWLKILGLKSPGLNEMSCKQKNYPTETMVFCFKNCSDLR
jgi:hypothetical protein